MEGTGGGTGDVIHAAETADFRAKSLPSWTDEALARSYDGGRARHFVRR